MPPFDPIASPTVRLAPHREPAFVFPDQAEAARQKLAAYAARTGRRPNILVILFDDVGWGDFGCYGGGVAVGAPTPAIDAARPARPPAHVVLLRALVLAVAGHAAHGPPAEAPRAAAPADVRRAGRPPGRGDAAAAPRRRRLCDAGRGQVASRRERGVAAAERGLRRLLRLPFRVGHVQRVARPRTSSRRSSTPKRARSGCRTCRSTSASCTRRAAEPPRTWRRSRSPSSRGSTTCGATTRPASSAAWPARPSRGSSITARAAPTSTTIRSSASSGPHRPATRTRTRWSSWTTSSDGSCASWKPAASSSTR